MTGSLILKGDPAEDLEAATKQYVDNHAVPAMVYEFGLPEKPSTPIADSEEIPYTWEQINAIALAGKAQEYFSLGSTKLVNLSTAVLGANAATMMVIGFDQDGESTVTFQTKGVLPTSTTFGSSAVWIGSTARMQCQNFYNACEAKDFIKTVSKGTCLSINNSRNNTATYNDETVWIPSEREMGLDSYSPISTANSTTSKAECTQGYNAAYSYYTSDATRVKYQMNANGTLTTSTGFYWERSLHYTDTNYACKIWVGGSDSYSIYSDDNYLAPAFVIGNSDAPSPSGRITQDGGDITDKVKGLIGSSDGFEIGDIRSSMRTDLGENYLLANGAEINQEEYPELFDLIKGVSFEQSDLELATTVDASLTSYINFQNFKILNGLYCIILTTSNDSQPVLLVSDNPSQSWVVRKFDTTFYSYNISYCNGYYVMVGNDKTYYHATSSQQKIIIAYSTNPLTTPFTLKEITKTDSDYYWSCTNTGMVYGKGKYHIMCNLYYTDDAYRAYMIGVVYSSSIGGTYTYNKWSSITDYGTTPAEYDEENDVFYLVQLYTRSGYKSNYKLVAFSDLSNFTKAGEFAIEQANNDTTNNPFLGKISKLNSGKWFLATNSGSLHCTFNPGTTPTKIADDGVLAWSTWAIGENITKTRNAGVDLIVSYGYTTTNVGNIYIYHLLTDGTRAEQDYTIPFNNSKAGGMKFGFVSTDGNSIYAFYSNDDYTIGVYKLSSKNFLPVITVDNCYTYIKVKE